MKAKFISICSVIRYLIILHNRISFNCLNQLTQSQLAKFTQHVLNLLLFANIIQQLNSLQLTIFDKFIQLINIPNSNLLNLLKAVAIRTVTYEYLRAIRTIASTALSTNTFAGQTAQSAKFQAPYKQTHG